MLQLVLAVHQVNDLGRLAQIAQQFVAGYAGQALGAMMTPEIAEGLVGQLHDNQQLAIDHLEQFRPQQKGVSHPPSTFQRVEFQIGVVREMK